MKSEDVIQALQAALETIAGVEVQRNTTTPEVIPDTGLIIIRDGDPGQPDEVLGGFRNVYYTHDIEIEAYVCNADQATRDAAWATLLGGISAALEADLTLDGEVFGFSYGAPEPLTDPVEGGHDIKQGVITLTAEYQSDSPLG